MARLIRRPAVILLVVTKLITYCVISPVITRPLRIHVAPMALCCWWSSWSDWSCEEAPCVEVGSIHDHQQTPGGGWREF